MTPSPLLTFLLAEAIPFRHLVAVALTCRLSHLGRGRSDKDHVTEQQRWTLIDLFTLLDDGYLNAAVERGR